MNWSWMDRFLSNCAKLYVVYRIITYLAASSESNVSGLRSFKHINSGVFLLDFKNEPYGKTGFLSCAYLHSSGDWNNMATANISLKENTRGSVYWRSKQISDPFKSYKRAIDSDGDLVRLQQLIPKVDQEYFMKIDRDEPSIKLHIPYDTLFCFLGYQDIDYSEDMDLIKRPIMDTEFVSSAPTKLSFMEIFSKLMTLFGLLGSITSIILCALRKCCLTHCFLIIFTCLDDWNNAFWLLFDVTKIFENPTSLTSLMKVFLFFCGHAIRSSFYSSITLIVTLYLGIARPISNKQIRMVLLIGIIQTLVVIVVHLVFPILHFIEYPKVNIIRIIWNVYKHFYNNSLFLIGIIFYYRNQFHMAHSSNAVHKNFIQVAIIDNILKYGPPIIKEYSYDLLFVLKCCLEAKRCNLLDQIVTEIFDTRDQEFHDESSIELKDLTPECMDQAPDKFEERARTKKIN
ncbi:hypothetical protein SPOG_03237 [Schizosaccharomyces cryophilus OY26]|uniref:Uncharacterized protein n=1 Tax=Schizosaccharomyces cryophilus (strain OY26 / ATCC MYA-4695 / CBS 11777 / NBRC 106824 / NRRL Y48691) TaxID=653667 RepID=S9X7K3_SCHCR|nr:uncharacterized protein SPOG_03237 [Schizosaccharomyces cryophilus OY26]EPY49761.1 hypothetical protein SPOG_03237 [Schizosaccharomyces cryophilus OY26]